MTFERLDKLLRETAIELGKEQAKVDYLLTQLELIAGGVDSWAAEMAKRALKRFRDE